MVDQGGGNSPSQSDTGCASGLRWGGADRSVRPRTDCLDSRHRRGVSRDLCRAQASASLRLASGAARSGGRRVVLEPGPLQRQHIRAPEHSRGNRHGVHSRRGRSHDDRNNPARPPGGGRRRGGNNCRRGGRRSRGPSAAPGAVAASRRGAAASPRGSHAAPRALQRGIDRSGRRSDPAHSLSLRFRRLHQSRKRDLAESRSGPALPRGGGDGAAAADHALRLPAAAAVRAFGLRPSAGVLRGGGARRGPCTPDRGRGSVQPAAAWIRPALGLAAGVLSRQLRSLLAGVGELSGGGGSLRGLE